MDDLRGIWAADTATYLTDLRHPVMVQEWCRWQLERGLRPGSPVTERERRQFDRDMVAKYAEIAPPPGRTPWHLMTYDFLDQKEIRDTRPKRMPRYEEEYIDEDI